MNKQKINNYKKKSIFIYCIGDSLAGCVVQLNNFRLGSGILFLYKYRGFEGGRCLRRAYSYIYLWFMYHLCKKTIDNWAFFSC